MTYALIHPNKIEKLKEAIRLHHFLTHYLTSLTNNNRDRWKKYTDSDKVELSDLLNNTIRVNCLTVSYSHDAFDDKADFFRAFTNYTTSFSLIDDIFEGMHELSKIEAPTFDSIGRVIAKALGKAIVISIAVSCQDIHRRGASKNTLTYAFDLIDSLGALTGITDLDDRIIYQTILETQDDDSLMFFLPMLTPYLANPVLVLLNAERVIDKLDRLDSTIEPGAGSNLIELIGKYKDAYQ